MLFGKNLVMHPDFCFSMNENLLRVLKMNKGKKNYYEFWLCASKRIDT